MRYYITPTEERQKELKRHQDLKRDRRKMFFFLLRKPVSLMDKYQRWRKIAQILKLSKPACQRLEWIIFYETKGKRNARVTCRYFFISPKTFYKWFNLFDEANLRTLADRSRAPKNTRQKEIKFYQKTAKVLPMSPSRAPLARRKKGSAGNRPQTIPGERLSLFKNLTFLFP